MTIFKLLHYGGAHAPFDDLGLDLDFEHVCKPCPTCFFLLLGSRHDLLGQRFFFIETCLLAWNWIKLTLVIYALWVHHFTVLSVKCRHNKKLKFCFAKVFRYNYCIAEFLQQRHLYIIQWCFTRGCLVYLYNHQLEMCKLCNEIRCAVLKSEHQSPIIDHSVCYDLCKKEKKTPVKCIAYMIVLILQVKQLRWQTCASPPQSSRVGWATLVNTAPSSCPVANLSTAQLRESSHTLLNSEVRNWGHLKKLDPGFDLIVSNMTERNKMAWWPFKRLPIPANYSVWPVSQSVTAPPSISSFL